MKKLAINGGKKVRNKPFPSYDVIDEKEVKAVSKILRSGVLSRFLGAWHEDFYGGPNVRSLEKEWAEYFGVKYAISMNSATSGLIAAVGAAGIGPGDEVIVTPYSMCISATAPLFYGATPVFADVEPEFLCLDPESVEKVITPKTKAIIVVDLMGQVYDAEKINAIAKKHNLIVIEDASQAPGAKYKGKYAGTLGDIGIFSLNYHKHIHSGEGGIVVTNDSNVADRLAMIRNHAEAVAGKKGMKDMKNLIGFNFRMTEIEAAIARIQLKKLKNLLKKRLINAKYLSEKLSKIYFLKAIEARPKTEPVWYIQPLIFNSEIAGIGRNKFIEAVKAELSYTKRRETEGVKISSGYVEPIYLLPVFQNKISLGSNSYNEGVKYEKGICPIVERLFYKELFYHDLFHPNMTKKDLDDVARAFQKVSENIEELK